MREWVWVVLFALFVLAMLYIAQVRGENKTMMVTDINIFNCDEKGEDCTLINNASDIRELVPQPTKLPKGYYSS